MDKHDINMVKQSQTLSNMVKHGKNGMVKHGLQTWKNG